MLKAPGRSAQPPTLKRLTFSSALLRGQSMPVEMCAYRRLKPGDAPSEVSRQRVIEWFGNTLSTRPDDKQVARLVVMQRIHVDDLVGHLLETEAAAAAAVVAKNVRLFIFKRLAAA